MKPRRQYMLQWAVTPATLKRYRSHVVKFLTWCDDHKEDANTDEELDDLLLDYIHELYEEGAGKTSASMTLYGILMLVPNLKGKVPKSTQAVKGWHKQVPGRTYPPLTWELAVTIATQLSRAGAFRAAVGVVLAFDCFLRISELCNLLREDVADSSDGRIGSEHVGMILRLRTTKTGKNQWVTVLDPSVKQLLRMLLRDTKKGQPLFPYTTAQFRRYFKASCADLTLSSLYVPHSLRHGGATRYRHVLHWTVEDILERGRWASTKSARRYIQSGVALLLAMEVPSGISDIGMTLAKDPLSSLTLSQKH